LNSIIKPNNDFTLSVRDIEIIELALNAKISRRSLSLMETPDPQKENELKEMRELLGRIHNQKNWYRPANRFGSGK
jgi:hypothetical protein|tara:strand:- start:293 stop:520 length:228 start_codon:yes stop_codon:yes gene_type:complete